VAQEPGSGESPSAVAADEPPTAPAAEQQGAADERPRAVFDEALQVKVVNVEVYVRDRQGNPITGLTADDFELIEEGRPMPITNFFEVREGQRVGDAPVEVVDAEPPGDVISSHPELERPEIDAVPASDRLHLVIYVDNLNIRPFNRNRVFRFVREFLRTEVDRSDRVMLVSYNRSLKVIRGFTSDPAVVARGLYELESHTGGRVQYDAERRDLLRDLQREETAELISSRVRVFAESVYNDLQFTLDALKDLMVQLGGIPGRKAFLYVSDGLPMRAAEELFHAVEEKSRNSGWNLNSNLMESLNYDATRRYLDLTRTANANDVTFYAIDASGLTGNSMNDAAMGFTDIRTNIDSIARSNLQGSLLLMADETGGQAIINTNNFDDGLAKVGSDFDHYYSLGYSPGHAGNGRTYRIDVKLKDRERGWRIRHRDNYRDKPIENEMAEATAAALNFGFQSNEMRIEMVPRQAARRDDGNYMVHVDVKIPIGEVVLLPVKDSNVARLRIWVQARDTDGAVSPVQVAPIEFEVPAEDLEQARRQFWIFELPLLMKSGDHRLSIGVRDDLAGRTSFVNRTIRVGA
jgi:VWFA-related protein